MVYYPQQNGSVEQKNKVIVERVRSIMHDKWVKFLWFEVVNTTMYLINHSPTRALPNYTPKGTWSGKNPNFEHLKVFGCSAFVHTPKEKRDENLSL